MGTTSQKLTYLNTTKQLLKTEINKINNVLTDESTFRSYPQELFNGYLDILNNGTDTLWSNLEKVSQTGTKAVLEGVETAPMKVELQGNTSQETTSGKNLLGLTNGTYSHNGITAVVNDGTITITGTATANSFVNIPLIKDIVLSNEQVTVSINNATTISDTATEFRVYESGTNYIPVQFTTIDRKTTITKTGTFVSAYVRTTSGVNYGSGLVIKPQLELGSTATSWEKYTNGASPNPDYPQEVKVVKGENVVSVSGKNLFNYTRTEKTITKNGVTSTINDDGSITLNGTATGVTWLILNSAFDWENGDYTMYLNNEEIQGLIFYSDVGSTRTIRSINVPSPITKDVSLRIAGGTFLNNVTIYPMILKGIYTLETIGEYQPYTKTDYPINLGDIELCKINTYKDFPFKAINGNEYYDTLTEEQKNALNYGSWYVHKEIEKVVLDGSENWKKTAVFYANVFYPSALSVGNIIGLYSQYFKYNYNATDNNSIFVPGIIGTQNSIIWLKTNLAATVEDFKTWLSTHNTIVYYVLATPTEEEITNTTLIEQLEAIYKAKSVKDKTYITQTNDELPFILDVEAIKEYEVN